MTTPNEPIQKQDPGVDIFNMQPPPQQEKGASGIKAKPSKQADKGFASKLGPVHFGAAAVIAAAVWIAWPSIFSSSAPSVNSAPRMLSPNEAMNEANHARQQSAVKSSTPQASPEQNAPDAAADNSVSATAAASVPDAVPAAAGTQPSAKEAELQAKVDELQGKLAQSTTQAANCPAPASNKSVTASAPRAHRVHSTPRRYVSAPPAPRPSDETVNPRGFTLNTIYRDQAWIQNAERTYVVQEGEVIDGLRIERVEPNTRQVITSLGVIR